VYVVNYEFFAGSSSMLVLTPIHLSHGHKKHQDAKIPCEASRSFILRQAYDDKPR